MKGVFVLPMAGVSARFSTAGYPRPKYELTIGTYSVFSLVVRGILPAFRNFKPVFAVRSCAEQSSFVRGELAKLGVEHFEIVETGPTDGQATTVKIAMEKLGVGENTELFIFNVDTFRLRLSQAPIFNITPSTAGLLEVFRGDGDAWSFVRDDGQGRCGVAETSEKRRISDLCCTGLYYFASVRKFLWSFEQAKRGPGPAEQRERYVAPLYNALINSGYDIRYYEVPCADVIFCGIPEEYEYIARNPHLLEPILR